MKEKLNSKLSNRLAGRIAIVASAGLTVFLAACGGGGAGGSLITFPGTEVAAAPLGREIAGLSGSETASFQEGFASFSKTEDAADGLGPVFNSVGCANCHSAGAIGGAGDNLHEAVVTRIGGLKNGIYSDLAEVGGPVLQARSLQEDDPSYPCAPEVIPPEAQFTSRRLTTPLFGAGLIEAIPASQILSRSGVSQGLGIKGHANYVTNVLTGGTEVGRFGWKAQLSNLEVFAADAYLNEMGVTNDIFGTENLPQGKAIPAEVYTGVQPNDSDHDLALLASFMRLLAPPTSDITALTNSRGGQMFTEIGCAKCHVPVMTTGESSTTALSNKVVRLYSDLLVHNMGAGLEDGIIQGQAVGNEFKTAPLWGLSKRRFFLHNGSASSIEDAILSHGGEAKLVLENFAKLSPADQAALVGFLGQL